MSKGESTKQHLMELAKAEFLEKGYNDASVRNIAKTAGLTTGAIFRYFPDKESIFAALVSPVAEEMLAMYRAGNEKGFDFLSEGRPQEMWGISKEVFALLINCSAGGPYEHFLDEMIAEEEKQSIAYLQGMRERGFHCADISDADIHVLLSAQYYAIFEIIRHDTPKDEALARVRLIADFFRPGWQKIYGG